MTTSALWPLNTVGACCPKFSKPPSPWRLKEPDFFGYTVLYSSDLTGRGGRKEPHFMRKRLGTPLGDLYILSSRTLLESNVA